MQNCTKPKKLTGYDTVDYRQRTVAENGTGIRSTISGNRPNQANLRKTASCQRAGTVPAL